MKPDGRLAACWLLVLAAVVTCGGGRGVLAAEWAERESFVNSLGMEMVPIPAGRFLMGCEVGEFDEQPIREVTIAEPFSMSATEVTNAQYEQFDPSHGELRGKRGLSHEDDEAVIFVSWHDAVAFCAWLSEREGRPYRLPTEAEWEYACRAGTTTAYHTGDTLPESFHKNQRGDWGPRAVPLHVGRTPPNAWGLYDMHGNVEEWCWDWYGPYPEQAQTDPVGYAAPLPIHQARVTRGGSHSSEISFLRSANRLGALPEERHWLIGFRVVQAEMPAREPLALPDPPRWARDVSQEPHDWSDGPDPEEPYVAPPQRFVRIPPNSDGPLYSRHNHCPDITPCPNGDLLATWYTTNTEPGRELTVAAARLRRGAEGWDPPAVFHKVPDRNMHATSIWWDRDGQTIYHFNGVSVSYGWGNLALFYRTSTDNGVNWSEPQWIQPEYGLRNMPIAGVIKTSDGAIVVPCDAVTGGSGGTAVHISRDEGASWVEPGAGTPPPDFVAGGQGGTIAGIHAGVVELTDGRWLALGRGDTIDGRMPMSVSEDGGRTWTYAASEFPPIAGGQRLVLMRLAEGPLFFASFTGPHDRHLTMEFPDDQGGTFDGYGLFGALSFDEGQSWPVRKLLTPGEGEYHTAGHTRQFTATPDRAEPRGYLAATQTPDGVIHLISSGLHYRFNLSWLQQPNPAPPPPPEPQELAVKLELETVFQPSVLPSRAGWQYTGTGIGEEDAARFADGGLDLITGANQRVRWADVSDEGFGSVDGQTGFTVEIRLQVTRNTAGNRGIDFECGVDGRRYFLTVTRTGVYWYDGGFRELAEGLDNHSEPHTYRLAVQDDGYVQIFRDGQRLAFLAPGQGRDPMLPGDGAYFQWGVGAGASEADARIAYVAYDRQGPFAVQDER